MCVIFIALLIHSWLALYCLPAGASDRHYSCWQLRYIPPLMLPLPPGSYGPTHEPMAYELKLFFVLNFDNGKIGGWCNWYNGPGPSDGSSYECREVEGTLTGNDLQLRLKHFPTLSWSSEWSRKFSQVGQHEDSMLKYLSLADQARKLSELAKTDNYPFESVVLGKLDSLRDQMEGTIIRAAPASSTSLPSLRKVVLKKLTSSETSRLDWCCFPNPPRAWLPANRSGPLDSLIPRMVAISLNNAGNCAMATGQFEKSKVLYDEAQLSLRGYHDNSVDNIAWVISNNETLLRNVRNMPKGTVLHRGGRWIEGVTGSSVNCGNPAAPELETQQPRRWVVVAARDISVNSPISSADLEEKDLPEFPYTLHPIEISIDAVRSKAAVLGRMAIIPIRRGQIITSAMLRY